MRSASIDINGIETRYLEAGSGHPLLLLHGIGMSADCFYRNISELSKSFHLIALDMLGHGFTGYAGLAGLPPQLAMARHAAIFMSKLGLPRYSVVGSSFGGMVGSLLHLEQLAEVNALIFAGSGSIFNTVEQQAEILRASANNALAVMQAPTFDSLRKRLHNIVYDAESVGTDLILTQMASYASPIRAKAYAEIIEQNLATNTDPRGQIKWRLEKMELPVLLIAGENDPRAPVDRQRQGVGGLKDGALIVYEACGHFPFLEYPQRFNADVREFLSNLKN